MTLRYVSTFLSHSWAQKEFALALARELTRRGMLVWIDQNELPVGINLDQELPRANKAQLTVTALLSKESLASSWCDDELKVRIDAAGDEGADAIIPVFIGDALALVQGSPLLRARWLTADGSAIRRLYAKVPDTAPAQLPALARRIAATHYGRSALRDAPRLVVAIDQRGKGRRLGTLGDELLPPNWRDKDWPTMVFRPDQGERAPAEVCGGDAWTSLRDTVVEALGDALETRRRREVHVAGNGQLALAWLVGTVFDRSSQAKVVAYNSARGGQFLAVDMDDSRFQLPLPLLDDASVRWDGAPPDAAATTVSAWLGAQALEVDVHKQRVADGDTTPLAVNHTGDIRNADDVIALARWLATATKKRDLKLYTALPFHAVVLLAGLLKHQVGRVTFMEYQRGPGVYTPCAMPVG